jgi:hypothetical protein
MCLTHLGALQLYIYTAVAVTLFWIGALCAMRSFCADQFSAHNPVTGHSGN